MGNKPTDGSADPSDGLGGPGSDTERSATRRGLTRYLRTSVATVGDLLWSVLARVGGGSHDGVATIESEGQEEATGIGATAGSSGGTRSGNRHDLPRRPVVDSRELDRRREPLVVTDGSSDDPPIPADRPRLTVQQHDERLRISHPGNPDAYITSTEWVRLER